MFDPGESMRALVAVVQRRVQGTQGPRTTTVQALPSATGVPGQAGGQSTLTQADGAHVAVYDVDPYDSAAYLYGDEA